MEPMKSMGYVKDFSLYNMWGFKWESDTTIFKRALDQSQMRGKQQRLKWQREVPIVAQWLTNPTRNHEVASSVPALAQWVNDLALPWAVV